MSGKKKAKQIAPAKQVLLQGLSVSRAFLQSVASLMGYVAYAAGHNRNMEWAEYEERQERKRRFEEREYLRYLERQKLIATKRIGEKLRVRLTAKGWQQAMRDKIKCTRTICKSGICVVIFDVPESERNIRDTLRWILKECGFEMIQKSVWATDKDILDELCALLQGANLGRWVRILVGNELKHSIMRRAITRLNTARKHRKRNGKKLTIVNNMPTVKSSRS